VGNFNKLFHGRPEIIGKFGTFHNNPNFFIISAQRLNISENDNSLDLDLVLSVCNYFRLSSKKARVIIIEITKSISTWKNIANEYQVSAKEVEMMADIFEPV